MAKDKDYNQLIHTTRWLRLRRDKLTASPLCEECKKKDVITAASEVHHIKPVETALTREGKARLMFSMTNLESVCRECHCYLHTLLDSRGREGQRRKAALEGDDFTRRFFSGVRDH